jgi:RNA polymerase subunit RPABC4/transcription elongation factor Spt4
LERCGYKRTVMKEPMKFEPADFHLCPICQGLLRENWCPNCKSNTILNWELLFIPPEEKKP